MGLQEIYDKLSFTDDSLIQLSDKDWKKKRSTSKSCLSFAGRK